MKRLQIYGSLILLLFFSSCVEKIDVKLDETYTRLVVYGDISDHPGKYRVDLSRTADYFYNQPVPRVVNAMVSLSDGLETYQMKETVPGVSGIYETDSTFAGIAGRTYILNIGLAQPIENSTNYTASTFLPPVTPLDSIQMEYRPDWGKEGIYIINVFALEPPEKGNYYMFKWFRNGVLMTDSIQEIFVSDDTYINGNYINGAGAAYIDNSHSWEEIRPGDTIMLEMSGITKEYYDFINEVYLAGLNIPLFTGPPANIVGNISNGGVGFFAAYSSSYATTIVK
jgi:hypothetical protein